MDTGMISVSLCACRVADKSRCPYPKDGSSSKRCIRYDTGCKFAEELHGIDTNIVRTTKV